MAETTYVRAITQALATAMRADGRVFVLGEDVAEGGPYTATAGLVEEFGTERVEAAVEFARASPWPTSAPVYA